MKTLQFRAAGFVLAAMASSCGAANVAQRPPIVRPGAPGQPSRVLVPSEAADLSGVSFTPDDVTFMQGMIGHHQQALDMTALLAVRTESDDMRTLGRRIELSQTDDINMMQRWLQARGQRVTDSQSVQLHGAMLMPGMLTPEEMARLAAAQSAAFDRLFLEGMIKHHSGALQMVEALFSKDRAAQDSEVFAFASEVDADQRMEIARMGVMLEARMK